MKCGLGRRRPSSSELLSLVFQSTYSVSDTQGILRLAELAVACPFLVEGNQTHRIFPAGKVEYIE